MDRYVIRESKVASDYPQGNQMIAFSPNTRNNTNMIPPETMYFGGYGAEYSMQRVGSSGYMGMSHQHVTPFAHTNVMAGQGQVMSGIDPRYLAAYGDNNASFIAGPQKQQMHIERNPMPTYDSPFAGDYQKRNIAGVERNKSNTFIPQAVAGVALPPQQDQLKTKFTVSENNNRQNVFKIQQDFLPKTGNVISVSPKQPAAEVEILKKESQNSMKTRTDKLKALYKSGPRAFSGPVEKVLKWHKALQDIGVLVIYEIVAKCVNVRAGELCSKNLVVRDDNGPAMQVVYYEIDFLLPVLKPPCTVRVIGRMMPGTCRLQAFYVRPATGDDVATLPRRAAVAAHHVAKLCKEYNVTV